MPDYNNITPDWVKNAVFYPLCPVCNGTEADQHRALGFCAQRAWF